MLGKYALSGYCSRKNRYNACRTTNPWYADGVSRIAGWINLFKHLDLKVTPDVVAVYLAVTKQNGLLGAVIDTYIKGYSYFVNKAVMPSEYSRSSDTLGSVMISANEFNWMINMPMNKQHASFAPELFEMARDYLINRTANFAETINSVLTQSTDGYCGGWVLSNGTRLPNKVINALNGYSISPSSSIETICNGVKGLYASMMPHSVLSNYRYGTPCSTIYDDPVMQFPSLRWDAASARPSREISSNSDGRGYSKVTPSIRDNYGNLITVFGFLNTRLCDILKEEKTTISSWENCRESFCLCAEMVLYITSLARCYSSTTGMIFPEVNEANRLIFKEQLELKKQDIHPTNDRVEEYDSVYMFGNLTPSAAICVGDLISWKNNGRIISFKENVPHMQEFLEKVNPNASGEVMTFLIHEYMYQCKQISYAESAAKQRKEDFEHLDEQTIPGRCCSDGPANC